MTKNATPTHRCLIGFDYVPPANSKSDPLRFEPGDSVTGLPAKTLRELAESEVVEAVEAAKPTKPAKDAA